MAELYCTARSLYLYTTDLVEHPLEEAISGGEPDYERLASEVRGFLRAQRVRGPLYLGLSPEFVLLRTAPFPQLEGFPLAEAVLAEAERSPFWGQHELVVDYELLDPLDEHRRRVLFAAMPSEGVRVLNRWLRPRRLEPLPLAVWRASFEPLAHRESWIVLESLTNSMALFEQGKLVDFRQLAHPLEDGGRALADEVTRSLQLFGRYEPVEAAWLFGLPEPPPLVEGLPAGEVLQSAQPAVLKAAAWKKDPPWLDLRPRRRRLGEGLPPELQRALLWSSLWLALGVAGYAGLSVRLAQQRALNDALRDDIARLEAARPQEEEPLPRGVTTGLLENVSAALPEDTWLDDVQVDELKLVLRGHALDPVAPQRLAKALAAPPAWTQWDAEHRDFAWEVALELPQQTW
jgi:hypothetical protein